MNRTDTRGPALRARLSMIRTIAWHEYLVNLRRPGFIFFTLLIPALGLLVLLVAAFFSGQASQFFEDTFSPGAERPAGVVDYSGLYGTVPDEFAGSLRSYPNEAAALEALLAEEVTGYVVIPADYLATGEVTAYARGGLMETVSVAEGDVLEPFLVQGLLAGRVDPAVANRVADPADVVPIRLDEQGQPLSGNLASSIVGLIVPYVMSIFLIIAVFTASSYLLTSVSEEKESRVIEVVLSSVSAAELLAGKVLGLGALGLTQFLIWIGSGVLLSGGIGALFAGVVIALNPLVWILAGAYFLLGYLLYGTLMAAAGAMGTSQREGQQLAGWFTVAASVPLMFNSLFLANPNSTWVRALSIFPLTAPTAMMLRLPLTTVAPLDILLSLGGLLLAIPLVVWGGAKVFRMGLLLYGKRPGLKQVARALREA
jgi:ABC-2 type transport system permease protein